MTATPPVVLPHYPTPAARMADLVLHMVGLVAALFGLMAYAHVQEQRKGLHPGDTVTLEGGR